MLPFKCFLAVAEVLHLDAGRTWPCANDSSKNAVLSGWAQGSMAQILSQKILNVNPDSADLVPVGKTKTPLSSILISLKWE